MDPTLPRSEIVSPTSTPARPGRRGKRPAPRAEPRVTLPAVGGDDGDSDREQRKARLADPALHASVLKVIRLRGVPLQDELEVLHDVIADACDNPGLPLHDPEQLRLYLGGSARHKAIDLARKRKMRREREVPLDPRMADPHTPPQDQVALAHQLAGLGERLFPRTFSWFLRARVQDEPHAEIAADANVSPDYVRSEVSSIGRALRAIAEGGSILMVLLAVLFGAYRWATRVDDVAHPRPPERPELRTPDELRDAASDECAREQWTPCLEHLTRAATLDPVGETPAWKELRARADRKLHELDAAPAP